MPSSQPLPGIGADAPGAWSAFCLGDLTIQVAQGRLQFGVGLVGDPLVAGLDGKHPIEAGGLQGFPLGLELFEGHGHLPCRYACDALDLFSK